MRALVPLFLLLAPLATQAQQTQKLVESVEVRVTNVDVVVTDKSGKPVTGLTRDDFTLFEDGKPQAITNFYEVRPDATAVTTASNPSASAPAAQMAANSANPPAVAAPRHIVIFVDNYSLHPFRRHEVFGAIDRSFDTLFRPGDEAMVVEWNRGMRVVVPFTSDREKLRDELHRYEKNAGAGAPLEVLRERLMKDIEHIMQAEFDKRSAGSAREASDQAAALARDYAQNVAANEKLLLNAMAAMVTSLAGLDGKKVMLVAGAELPAQPGLEMFQYVDQLFAGATVSANSQRSSATWNVTPELERLARQANANNVTMYMLDGGNTMSGVTSGADDAHLANRSLEFNKFSNTARSLTAVAQLTGGMALTRTNNFDLAVSTMANDLGAYYSLGYRPSGEQAGDRHIVVHVNNPAYTVRARTTYTLKSSDDRAEDRVIANAFHGNVPSEIHVKIDTGMPSKYSNDRFKVPVRITFPSDLTLLPNGDQLEGGFTVILVVVDDDGTMSNVTRRHQPVKLPKSALQAMLSRPVSFTAEVLVSPGDHYISVGIVDDIANTSGFARARVRAH